jgi:hypothetical protein
VVDLISNLEPRVFNAKEIIYDELEEVNEVYFMQTGSFDVGYSINNLNCYRIRFGSRQVIGAFNVFF